MKDSGLCPKNLVSSFIQGDILGFPECLASAKYKLTPNSLFYL